MHLRKLVGVCGFAVLVLANYASALGLGEIKLNSALNQPLDAEIKLLDTRDLSTEQIIVALGSPADFERNGVDRLYFYTELEFEVLLNQPGGAIVRISTRNPVREPFLNFLVEARWPSGRLLREYTLLMDLPTFADAPSTPVESATSYPQTMTQPRTGAAVQTSARSSSPASPQADLRSESAPASGGRRSGSDSYGPVGSNETLWKIALNVRPDRGLSVHQTMLAIQRLNPDAFINGNINLLRKGQVLRLPSADEIRSMSRSEAVAEVAAQNRDWSENTMGAQLNASRREVSSRREAQEVSGQVRLASPGSNSDGSGQGSGSNAGDSRGLENELAATLEELDKTRIENSELNSRIRDLEEQISTMERLVDVSNEQLRAMQLAASQQQATADAPQDVEESDNVQPLDGKTEEPEVSADVVPSEPALESEPELPESQPAATPVPVAEPEQAKPAINTNRVVQSAPKSKTIVDHIVDNAIWIGVGLLVLLLAAYVLIRRRNEQATEEEIEEEDNPFSMSPLTDDTINEEYQEDYLSEAEEEMPLFDEDNVPAEAETGDAVAEADIYIAYGKFDQAEEMLLNALSREPSSVPIRMKLLEVYSHTENVDSFDQHYASLLGDANHSELQRAAEMRESIPGAGEFDSGLDLSGQDNLEVSSADDTLDFGLDDDVYGESPKPAEANADDDFSFDLDLEDEPPSSLVLGETLSRESDVGSATTRYDLSFDESLDSDAASDEDEFTLDLEDDFLATTDEVEEKSEAGTFDDELEELSFELDDEPSATETTPSSAPAVVEDDDFTFDFEEKESVTAEDKFAFDEITPVQEEASTAPVAEDNTDDFNPDMDMSDLDLEALDHEMESLDAEFGEADDKAFADLDAQLDDEQVSLTSTDVPDADDDMFEEALSGVSAQEGEDMSALGAISDADMDAELDFLADTDEAATKLDLARAYIDMGDTDGARDILAEVVQEGNPQQREEAEGLLSRIDA